MTRLLLSVRNLEEAYLLPIQDIGILDVKEPERGPLGCADLETIASIHRKFQDLVPISAALGELADPEPFQLECLPPIDFAKFGLSRMQTVANWTSIWSDRISQLPSETQPVAVIYADWKSCGAPPPEQVISAAIDAACSAILIDTFEKSKGSLLQWLEIDELIRITQLVRTTPAKWVLAGGLRRQPDLQSALQLQPDLIGVRGAICSEDRASKISPVRLDNFFRQFANLTRSNGVSASRSIQPETARSESRNEGITR